VGVEGSPNTEAVLASAVEEATLRRAGLPTLTPSRCSSPGVDR